MIVAQSMKTDATLQVSQVILRRLPAPASLRAPMSQATVRIPNTATM